MCSLVQAEKRRGIQRSQPVAGFLSLVRFCLAPLDSSLSDPQAKPFVVAFDIKRFSFEDRLHSEIRPAYGWRIASTVRYHVMYNQDKGELDGRVFVIRQYRWPKIDDDQVPILRRHYVLSPVTLS